MPGKIDTPGAIDVSKIQPHGLLYLENSYVVPGGMFNEMYRWDSYFIIRGLLRVGRIQTKDGHFSPVSRLSTGLLKPEVKSATKVLPINDRTSLKEPVSGRRGCRNH